VSDPGLALAIGLMRANPSVIERSVFDPAFWSDGLLELFGGPERDLFGGFDLNFLAGGRITPLAGGAFADLENAEADNADAITLLEMLGDARDHVAQDRLGGLLRQFMVLGQGRREMLERYGARSEE